MIIELTLRCANASYLSLSLSLYMCCWLAAELLPPFFFQCKPHPEPALYNGGVLRWASKITDFRTEDEGNYSPAFVLYNMSAATAYSFSCKLAVSSSCVSLFLLAVP